MKEIIFKALGLGIGGAIAIILLTSSIIAISKVAVIAFGLISIDLSVGEFAISFILVCILFVVGFIATPKQLK